MVNERSKLLGNKTNGNNSNLPSYLKNPLRDGSNNIEKRFYTGSDKRFPTQTPESGLSSIEAARRFKICGPNQLPPPDYLLQSTWRKILQELRQPLSLTLWFAIALELVSSDLRSTAILFLLQSLNVISNWYWKQTVQHADEELRALLKHEARVIRDGVHQKINASMLVPGDRITLSAGACVPADCELCEGNSNSTIIRSTSSSISSPIPTSSFHMLRNDNTSAIGKSSNYSNNKTKSSSVHIDQSLLTGECFPVVMVAGDSVKMGSIVIHGEGEAIVTCTGARCFLSKTARILSDTSMHITSKIKGRDFQSIVLKLAAMLTAIAIVLVGGMFGVLWYASGRGGLLDITGFCTLLLVTCIPYGMASGTLLLMVRGTQELARYYHTVVPKPQTIASLASLNFLLCDKTGTLTRNTMELQDDLPIFFPTATREDALVTAALASRWKEPPRDAIDTLVLNAIDLRPLDQYVLLEHHPFDPTRKRTESTILGPTKRVFKVAKGAPHVLLKLAYNQDEIREAVEAKVMDLARRGIRSLAVARTDDSDTDKWIFLGIITFLDPPRFDTKRTIDTTMENGLGVKLITGDQAAIAVEISRAVGLGTTILGANALSNPAEFGCHGLEKDLGDIVEAADGFAEILPSQKGLIVETMQKRGWLCAVTGVNVSDVPALKKSDVGIAVDTAMDAARAVADIVLLKPGISVIANAILAARSIFQRMKIHITMRMARTVHLLVVFLVAVIWMQPNSCQFAHFVPYEGGCAAQVIGSTITNSQHFAATYNVDTPSNGTEGGENHYEPNNSSVPVNTADHPIQMDDEVVPSYVILPMLALALLTILNEFVLLVIPYDQVTPNNYPSQWTLPRIYWISGTIGLTSAVSTLLLLSWGLDSWSPNAGMISGIWGYEVDAGLHFRQVLMLMFLKIVISDTLMLFSLRTDISWTSAFRCQASHRNACRNAFVVCGVPIAVMAIATALSVLWPFEQRMEAITFRVCIGVWIYCIMSFILQDIAKVVVIRVMDHLAEPFNIFDEPVGMRARKQVEAQLINRIQLGGTFNSFGGDTDETIRDSFVAGRAVRSLVARDDKDTSPKNLEDALDRLAQCEEQIYDLQQQLAAQKESSSDVES